MIYSYKITRDYGFAPNPFWGYCTLANCKPKIRKKANIGDWIIGTGAKTTNLEYHLIFIMQVTEITEFQNYWDDQRFQCKKPNISGSLVQMHGDNIYNKQNENWNQIDSHHSYPNGVINKRNLKQDLGGKYILISELFYYFGNAHFELPDEYKSLCCKYRDRCKFKENDLSTHFLNWISENYEQGIHGDPIDWNDYNQKTIPFNL